MGKDKKHKKEKSSKRDRRDKEKKRKRDRSVSSSSDSSDEEDRKRRQAAKMAKKVETHLKKHTLGGFDYTDEDNPFGDQRLSERFVWGKKIEKQLEQGADIRQLTAKAEQRRQTERIEEIEKVKKRREQREAEREAMAEELELIQRERARAEAVELEKKEEEFHLEQTKVRAAQRMEAGRPKAIDLITNNLFLLDGFDPSEADPSSIIASLNIFQLKELKADVDTYRRLDARDTSHTEFWNALAILIQHELSEATKQDEIDRARVRGLPPPEKYAVREAGWHTSLDADVAVMLTGKTHNELTTLEQGIREQLESGDAVDPDYWHAVLRRLQIFKTKALLLEFHAMMMQKYIDKCMAGSDVPKALVSSKERLEQARREAERHADAMRQQISEEEEEEGEGKQKGKEDENKEEKQDGKKYEKMDLVHDTIGKNEEEIELPDEDVADEELEARAATDIRLEGALAKNSAVALHGLTDRRRGEPLAWDDLDTDEQREYAERQEYTRPGEYSPKPLPPEYVIGQDVISEEADLNMLQLLRTQVKLNESQRFVPGPGKPAQKPKASTFAETLLAKINKNKKPEEIADPAEAQFRATAAHSMGDLSTSGDAPFGGEVALDAQVYWWHEKHRPRKPKYFNRVHTGFDWNKYNRTHYDGDNPPPKVVQGYKFNIFYPDLIDKSKAPSFAIEKDPNSPDGSTCVIRFTAGPPYEDIAFRIVNREWSYDSKRGFKSVFDRGILHLYFSFKRSWYRR